MILLISGAIVQYPNDKGSIEDYRDFIKKVHGAGGYIAMATDLLALTLLTPPGELGADVAVGSAQRFGVPLGYGGPHAAFLSAKDDFKRNIPGRIIGVSIDAQNNRALRMALQTREQHIKREKPLLIFVQHRHCWRIWPLCMQYIMERKD
ncbi:MAG: hypothetical protein WDO71_14250 [Bacteroidota bacterium]